MLPDNRMTPFNPALLKNGIAVAALLYVIFTPALLLVLGFIFSLFGGWPPAFEGSAGGVLFLFGLNDDRPSAVKEITTLAVVLVDNFDISSIF